MIRILIYILVAILFMSQPLKSSAHSSTLNSSLLYNTQITDFVPRGYYIVEQYYGDLNKDGLSDVVLLIKKKDNMNLVENDFGDVVDRNRRGIIILFQTANGYELASKNYECFSSENEDGGVYYAPELEVEVKKGLLYFSYRHGRYGYWTYTFRYQKGDFELIGYDVVEANGPVFEKITSINFSTKKKQVKVNTNENASGEDEKYRETWSNIANKPMIRLSQIEDFDSLDMWAY